jgi:hypothetical protein
MKTAKTIELVSAPSAMRRGATVWIIRCIETGEILSSSTNESEERARLEYLLGNAFTGVAYRPVGLLDLYTMLPDSCDTGPADATIPDEDMTDIGGGVLTY